MVNIPRTKCYLCGKQLTSTNRTKDHLFPEGCFPKPLPSNLPPRLPACEQCNDGLSKDEELFRALVASGMAYESKAGFRVWTEKIRPDLKGRRAGLKTLLQSLTKVAPVISESGEFLGLIPILESDPEPVNRVLRKIAKGLYFLETGQILPSDIKILVGYDEGKPERFVSPPLDEAIKGAIVVELGDGVVTYWRNTIKDDPASSLTWLEFYQDKVFLICTYH